MKHLLRSVWFLAAVSFLIGLSLGVLATRWHYHHLTATTVACHGSVNYYDKTGKVLLYSDPACKQ